MNLFSEMFFLTLASGVLVAAASGLIGSFLVLRKMTLLSDALSHVALPGIALGVVLKFQPILGGVAFLFLGIFLISQIENKTKLAVESITGVLFVTALAVGALLIPQQELLEAFFGNVQNISLPQIILQSAIALFIIILTLKNLKKFTLVSIAPDLAATAKISPKKVQFLLLALIAFTIAVGISFVGILLMSALSIIPAVTARNLSKNFKAFLLLSVILAVFSLTAGLLISKFWPINPGIATVLVSAGFFVVSLFMRRK